MNLRTISAYVPPAPLLLTATALLGTFTLPARGSEVDARRVPNHAFATQLGSGVYDVNGRTVQIYRFAPSLELRSVADRKWGLRLRFPLTLGFYRFTFLDVVSGGLPDRLASTALVPTIEMPIIVARNWFLTPSAGIGIGKDLSVGSTSYIYAVGVSSLALFSIKKQDIRLGNRFVYTGYTTKHLGFRDDFGLLESGLDVRRPLGIRLWGHELAGSLFGVNYLYVISPQLIRQIEESLEFRANWELGFTLGTVESWKVLGLRLPRLGLSYRFGEDKNAVRFIIGNPFPLDPPGGGARDQKPEKETEPREDEP